jgi:hypothetical protein
MNILDSVNFIRNWRSGKILRKKWRSARCM